jgi:hypothetical protein
MSFRFPLDDVTIEQAQVRRKISEALYNDAFYSLNQDEFSMDVKEVAWFYASGGNYISIVEYPGAAGNSVELYLNGSVYGAILHQRKILPLHGSCFSYEGSGIMICGDTGAGKSSLTASFCLDGAVFLTDDITPLLFKEGKPFIWALSARIKLWSDTLKQLEQGEGGLQRVDPGWEKYYYPMQETGGNASRLDQVYILEIKKTEAVEFEELSGSLKFSALRNEIYRPEYLKGMPENEPVYFKNLIDISNNVEVIKVKRPMEMRVQELMRLVKEQMAQG